MGAVQAGAAGDPGHHVPPAGEDDGGGGQHGGAAHQARQGTVQRMRSLTIYWPGGLKAPCTEL